MFLEVLFEVFWERGKKRGRSTVTNAGRHWVVNTKKLTDGAGGLAISGHRLVEGLAREAPNTSRKVDNYTVCRSLSEVELAW